MPGAVVDTNVFISAIKKTSLSRKVLIALADNKFKLYLSHPLREELERTILRPKVQKMITDIDGALFMKIIVKAAEIVSPSTVLDVCRDPKDNMLLECALEAKADFVVTGDQDLLILNPFDRIEILSPANFLKRLGR